MQTNSLTNTCANGKRDNKQAEPIYKCSIHDRDDELQIVRMREASA